MKKAEDIRSTASDITMKIVACVLLLVTCNLLLVTDGSTGVSDRVAAFVDDEAITNSELQEQYTETLKITPDITKDEVLNTMINRVLILRQAKKYRIEGPSPDEVIKEYIDLKVRAVIRVPETEIEKYYKENSSMFSGKEYDDIRDDIEKYLTEKELNARLKETLRELRKTAYIKILSKQGQ
ncbi:MAG: hypothetical protein CVV37_02690 [Nitrospira bacterium HGW-Nitrospira-1]|nr:MAG: hypothetical protein CVV37_02690 [Nitrospira bacterium HGW-Nitrospira-1]